MSEIDNILANCYECQDNSNGYHCAHCGEHCDSYQCHYWGDGTGGFAFTCKQGKENTARRLSGLEPKWEYGVEIGG